MLCFLPSFSVCGCVRACVFKCPELDFFINLHSPFLLSTFSVDDGIEHADQYITFIIRVMEVILGRRIKKYSLLHTLVRERNWRCDNYVHYFFYGHGINMPKINSSMHFDNFDTFDIQRLILISTKMGDNT